MRRVLPYLTAALLLGTTPGAAVQVATAQDSAAPTAACTLPPEPLPTRTRAVVVLDTSGSMRGIGDGQANIFGPVKESIRHYIQVAQPDQLELLTFDSGIRSRHSYALPADDARFQLDLSNLRANGANTWLYRSLTDALTPLTGREQYITNVFVLTDGIDNERGRRATAVSALESFRGRGPLDSLTYIALGTDIPPRARRALENSDYASGLTLPRGQAPDLSAGIGTSFASVTDPAQVPVPYPDGTGVTITGPGLALVRPQVQGREVALQVSSTLPPGTHALLCTVPSTGPRTNASSTGNTVGQRPARLLLTLNLGRTGTLPGSQVVAPGGLKGLIWLNPGANLRLKPGQDVALRYRAPRDLPLDTAGTAVLLPGDLADRAGVRATLERLPSAHEFVVRVQNLGSQTLQAVTPRLQVGHTGLYELPAVTLQPGNGPGSSIPESSGQPQALNWRRWLWLPLLLLLLLGALALWRWLVKRRRKVLARRREQVVERSTAAPAPAAQAAPRTVAPAIEGIEYRADRTLALFTAQGEMRSVPTPLGGPFDIGMLAKVPLLSGLRVEQDRDGLRVLNIPADLEVSQGGRLLQSGDVVRPATLLGVAVARLARAPHPPLGSLVGLGVPLTLHPAGQTLHVVGPYGTHSLELAPGVTDLGAAFAAPALAGLKLSPAGSHILLADIQGELQLHAPGDEEPLRPGTYLPAEVLVSLPRL